jgi:hypothetical protein
MAQERGSDGRFAKKKVQDVKIAKATGRKKVHAGAYVHDEAYAGGRHDLTPWIESPGSTRVSAYRYDYLNDALQVTWRNNKNHGYIYLGVPYEGFRSFARAASKGKNINSHLNTYEYRMMDAEELEAPSNPERSGVVSRQR